MDELDVQAGRPPVTGRTRSFVIAMDRLILVVSRHWLAFLNLFIFGYVGLPFLAPVFMKAHLLLRLKSEVRTITELRLNGRLRIK